MSISVPDLKREIDRIVAGLDDVETAVGGTENLIATITPVSSGASIIADVNAALAVLAGQRLYGFSVREDVGVRATFNIMRGATVAGGTLLYTVTLNPYESTSDFFGSGLPAETGISIDWVEGSFRLILMS